MLLPPPIIAFLHPTFLPDSNGALPLAALGGHEYHTTEAPQRMVGEILVVSDAVSLLPTPMPQVEATVVTLIKAGKHPPDIIVLPVTTPLVVKHTASASLLSTLLSPLILSITGGVLLAFILIFLSVLLYRRHMKRVKDEEEMDTLLEEIVPKPVAPKLQTPNVEVAKPVKKRRPLLAGFSWKRTQMMTMETMTMKNRVGKIMRLFFSKQHRDASTPLRLFGTLWFLFILVIGTMASITAHSTHAVVTPYAVTITSNNFHVPFVTVATDDISDPGNARFSLQNGSSLWYSISITSTPSGIVPTAATTNDLVATTLLGSTPLLPPAQVLPFDSSNGSYSFETLKLKTAFSGPGQQIQLELVPLEQHAVTLDVLTLLLQLLGQKQTNVQIGLLETGVLQNVFTELGGIKDFTSLVGNYRQVLRLRQDAILPHAYACAQNIASLLSDSGEQSALADVYMESAGKGNFTREYSKSIESFAQAQFGLAIEGFINNEVGTMAGMFSQNGNPTVQLQTISTATPSVTPSISVSSSPTLTPHPSHNDAKHL